MADSLGIDAFVSYIPQPYRDLASAWGLPYSTGAAISFATVTLLLWGLFYLGLRLAFGSIASGDEYKKIFTLLALGLAVLSAYQGAGIITIIFSNLFSLAGLFIGLIVIAAIGRAILSGWYGAGASLEEARADYFESLSEREKAKMEYIKSKKQVILNLSALVDELYKKYGDSLNDKMVIRYLKSIGLYDDYIKVYGSERNLRKAIRDLIKKSAEVAKMIGKGTIKLGRAIKAGLNSSTFNKIYEGLRQYIEEAEKSLKSEKLKVDLNNLVSYLMGKYLSDEDFRKILRRKYKIESYDEAYSIIHAVSLYYLKQKRK